MAPDQEWCLQCGAGTPGSLETRTSGWRVTGAVLAATALLVIGAATAAYAALSKSETVRHVTIAQVPAPTTTTPVTPTTAAPPPSSTPTPTPAPAAPATTSKPPKIPLTAVTPKPAGTTPKPSTTTPKSTTKTPVPTTSKPAPTPILLDTNAVTTYNPAGLPASSFGDPSLAIDGDTSTGWTARVEPATAPKMSVGLVIDLNNAQTLSSLELVTSTPGMTIQVFGANGTAIPATITDPAWTALSGPQVEKKRHQLVKLSNSTKAFRFVALWISVAPAASVGTPEAPGRVSVNELELFQPA
jgi:hypothetical protein